MEIHLKLSYDEVKMIHEALWLARIDMRNFLCPENKELYPENYERIMLVFERNKKLSKLLDTLI